MRIGVLLISVLLVFYFLQPVFHDGIYISHDGEAHIARFAAYFKAFSDFQIPPRWASDLNFRYGSPVFIFYYPLPGYIASLLYASGFSLINSYKLLMSLSFILSGVSFYFWIAKHVRINIAVVGAILYMVLPYHILDMYVRGDIAEMLSFVFVPLVFFYLDKLKQEVSTKHLLLGGLSYSFLILSHNAVSLMFSPVLFAYAMIFTKKKEEKIASIIVLLFGLSLSAFFWLPALIESSYVTGKTFIADMYKDHFPSLTQLIYSPWGFGADVNKIGGLSPQIGIIYIAAVMTAIYYFFIHKVRFVFFWVVVFLFSVFLMTPFSSIVWNGLPLLKLFQFPWRLNSLAGFSAVVIMVYFLNHIKNSRYAYVLCFLTICFSMSLVTVKGYEKKDNNFYFSFTGTTDFHGEASPIWTAGDPYALPKKEVEVIDGKVKIVDLKRKSAEHNFKIISLTGGRIVDNTLYFPGWQVMVDNKKVPVEFQDINYRGLITFAVPKGEHHVSVRFTESKIRFIADLVSLITIIVCGAFYFRNSKFLRTI